MGSCPWCRARQAHWVTLRAPLPVDLRVGSFSRRQALDAGISASRLRASDLTIPFRGVRSVGTPADIHALCRAYLARMSPGQAFSHGSAARLYGLPLPRYLDDSRLHVTVLRGSSPPAARGVVGHELDATRMHAGPVVFRNVHPDEFFELPVVEPAVAWAQLASALDLIDVIALGDAVVARGRALASLDDLRRVTAEWSGQRGSRALARALPFVRDGSWSRAESLHRLLIVRAGILEPELNLDVTDRAGRMLSKADEVWPEYRVLAEYEGDGHREKSRFRRDITRFELYADADWSALRAHADDVFVDPNPFIGRLWRRLVARGWVPPHREPRRVAGARA